MAEAQSKRIPSLVWIILAAIVVVGAWMLTHHDGVERPPGGGPAIGQAQTGGGPGEPVMPQQPRLDLSPTPPPAPNGAGPTNQPGVLSQPTPNGAPS